MENFDFSGWATKYDTLCSDGRIIRRDAFKHLDGKKVPLIWGHQHNDPNAVLGHALLEDRKDGMWAYGKFNTTESGKNAKMLVESGDIEALSIYANQLQQSGPNVMHGNIRELSLVVAGANPGASIQSVIIQHGDDETLLEDEGIIYTDETITLAHADNAQKEETKVAEETKKVEGEKTVAEVFDTLTEEQKTVVYAIIGQALEDNGADDEDDDDVKHSEGGDKIMKTNIFDMGTARETNVLSHSAQQEIVAMAKQSNVGSLKMAMEIYAAENDQELAHSIYGETDINEYLMPDYELLKKGAPELLERDQSWIAGVLNKIHKSPISRIRTRQADARIAELRAKGYQKKGDQKQVMAEIKMVGRTTDPQTIYIKSDMHRDDIVDITDFDTVAYQWNLMRHLMNEELALAALIGDGREDGDPDKIHETHIRSVWNDDELYTIHADVDIAAAKDELQGSNTGANFGENYIYAEAIITAALYAREKYKGSGALDLYCTPHMLNVMLLARDLNGRRIYDSKADLAAALNVNAIHTVEQFEGKTRTTEDGETKKLLGLFVNMADYQFGCTKGGEITKFEDFDMDFNKFKYMLETRLSGSLTKLYSAIALEEPVEA